MAEPDLILCQNVRKTYLGKAAVSDLTLALHPGQVYALLGPNGSGKTTLMKMITGLVKPTSGNLFYCGSPLSADSRSHIAYMSTEPYFYSYMRVSDAGNYYRDFFADFDPERYAMLLDRMELSPKDKIRSMSSGMIAKMKIALTLARSARLFLLDEPLNGIDVIARDRILQTIREAFAPNRTFVLSSHLVEEMEPLIDTAFFLKDGVLASCMTREEIAASGQPLVELYKQLYA